MTSGSFHSAGVLLLPIAVPAGALISMAIYAARSPSESDLAASRAALARLFEGFDLQDHLRAQTVHFAGAHAERAVSGLGATPAGGPAESADRGRPDVDAIIEVAAESVALEQVWDTRPDFGLAVAVRARLVSRGRELYAADMTYRGGARPLVEWAADECRALRQELVRAAEALAERVVDEMFLVERGQ